MTDAPGTLDERFTALPDLLRANVEDGTELGVSLCVVHNGDVVVDIWDGWFDRDKTLPWQQDTLTPVWSITKTMTNLAALVLVDRDQLDVNERVAHYWPEFGANGKADVLVRHLLGHTSGVSGWAQPVTVDDLYDWDKSTAMLAAQEPWWEPGSASGYHLLNQGHLVGEVIRRITGLSLGQFFAKEIAGPLGADFHIGMEPADFDRVSPVTPPRPLDLDLSTIDPDGIPVHTFTGPFVNVSETRTDRWKTAEIPAANGHGNARSVARVQSLVSHGGEIDGVRLLSPKTLELIFNEQAHGKDVVLDVLLRFGIGYALPEPKTVPSVPHGRRCFWGGLGGSFVLNDLENNLTIAYVMNKMIFEYAPGTRLTRPVGDSRSDAYIAAIYEALE
ncbi:MAG: beta-lactamase family protein [Kineosporiaceae bacterium]|nr:beta-lactamase family protein [Aeromicrobium sp.]